MIWVRLMGGMGNQMFQYAAGRRLAIRCGTDLVLDCSWFAREASRASTPREFALQCFDLPATTAVLPAGTVAAWEYCSGHPIRSRLSRHAFRRRVAVVRQPEHDRAFQSSVLDAPRNTLLVGYWQSERYFADVRSTILQDFSFPAVPSRAATAVLEHVDGTTAVGVHVRRGDYVGDERRAGFVGAPSVSYYRDAVGVVAEREGSIHLFVFSDDPEWCRRELAFDHPTTFVESGSRHPGDDLMLMSRCRHQVISNSTFGWWGAWLNPSNEKIVVAPRRWFGDGRADGEDPVPAAWLRI